MEAVRQLAPTVGVRPACWALGVARASSYRRHRPPDGVSEDRAAAPPARRPAPPRALRAAERPAVRALLPSPRFQDAAPAAVYATLRDEGTYLAAAHTLYRLLAAAGETRERRNQRAHPPYPKPERLATRPNAIWSGDITKRRGSAKWTDDSLSVILASFSRYVTGWLVAHHERASLAERLMAEAVEKPGIVAGRLTIPADRGPAMTSKPGAYRLADLGLTRTHSRPPVSNDNPYAEAPFKTRKYRPGCPARFGGMEDARAFCPAFFRWYNTAHRPAGIGLLTPAAVHHGRAAPIDEGRRKGLAAAAAERRVDQSAAGPNGNREGESVNSRGKCLSPIDRFRLSESATVAGRCRQATARACSSTPPPKSSLEGSNR